MIPTFIDFEASSLDLISSYPLEVGLCYPDGTTESWLIKPHVLWLDWSESAEKIHGLTRSQLIEEGIEVSEAAEKLNSRLGDIVYCDAWTFDSFWLYRLYKAAKIKPTFQLESIAAVLDEKHIGSWQKSRDEVIKSNRIKAHRAANDALILHKIWKKLHP